MNQNSKPILYSGKWEPENKLALEKLILAYGKHHPNYDPSNKPVAVFDWDHTCIAGDIGVSTFCYIVDNLLFKFEPDYLFGLIGARFYRDEIVNCYRRLSKLPLETAKRIDEYRRYRVLLIKASDGIAREEGVLAVCTWMVKLLKGLSVSEVRSFTEQALEQELEKPVGAIEVETSNIETTRWGVSTMKIKEDSTRIFAGIRIYEEMKDLIEQLQIHGFEVWVVSASCKWIIETVAIRYGISPCQVIGIVAQTSDGTGTITGEILNPIPVEEGKVESIRHFIKKRPILVAGDTIHDLPMLEYSNGLRLVIERSEEELLKAKALQNGWLIQPGFTQ